MSRGCVSESFAFQPGAPGAASSGCRRSRRASAGKCFHHRSTTASVPTPPSSTEPTGPSSAAVAPDSNSPSWLLAPMNTEFTAVHAAPHLVRGFELDQRLADHHTEHVCRAADRQRRESKPERFGPVRRRSSERPKTATAPSSLRPTRRAIGMRDKVTPTISTPSAGAERRMPRPSGAGVQDVAARRWEAVPWRRPTARQTGPATSPPASRGAAR